MRSILLQPDPSRRRLGFTLVELMIASALAAGVLTAFAMGFSTLRRGLHQRSLEQELHQNVRNALGFIQRDLRYAGSGLVMGTDDLNLWFGNLSGVTRIPHLVAGGNSGADSILTAGYAGGPVASLRLAVISGENRMEIDPVADAIQPYQPRVGDVLVLSGVEAVQVTAVDGNTLNFRTDPRQQTAGLHLSYPAGVDVFLLNVVRYALQTNNAGVPALTREDSRFTYATPADMRVAEDIEDLRFSRTGDLLGIRVTGRTRAPVPGLRTPADGRARYTLETSLLLKNPSPRLNIHFWDPDLLLGGGGETSGGSGLTP